MGIRKQEFYIVVCDECNQELQNGEGGALCLDKVQDAKDHATMAEWKNYNGKLLCVDCYDSL